MPATPRSARYDFLAAGLSLLVTVATGAEWVGEPFRPVHLVTIIGLGMTTGVLWMQAMTRYREGRSAAPPP